MEKKEKDVIQHLEEKLLWKEFRDMEKNGSKLEKNVCYGLVLHFIN